MIIFIDLETTGLDPAICRILEMAMIATNDNLKEIDRFHAILQRDQYSLHRMDEKCRQMHIASGLLDEVAEISTSWEVWNSEGVAATTAAKWVRSHCGGQPAIMAGSSVHFDRAFISARMPALIDEFHYRVVDVSSIAECARRWRPDLHPPEKLRRHRAMDDVLETIDELRFYKEHLFGGNNA